MKKIITACAIIYSYNISAQSLVGPCDGEIFHTDSTKFFLISEIKPLGDNRFVELWNCRETDYFAEMWYVSGMYSAVMDSFANQMIHTEDWLVLPLPLGLYSMDAIRIVTRKDTSWNSMATVMYSITDSSQSISLCDWYRETVPTPNESNVCETNTTVVLTSDSELVYQECFDILGIPIDCNVQHKIIIKKLLYSNGVCRVQKILH
jgi:hypothetical protein